MEEPSDRLRKARKDAGFQSAAQAAEAYGWTGSTYASHENGTRGLRPAAAARYAKAFKVPAEWLLYGKGRQTKGAPQTTHGHVPLVGYVAAGAAAHFMAAGELGEVPAPDHPTDATVAVEIRGDSLGSFFDRWLVYYDDVRRPITSDLVGRLCVVGLSDGRVLIKKPVRSRTKGLFHLLSQTEDPILDAEVEWAARVKSLVPR